MDARTALKNYTNAMVKAYGENYWESWTEDDKKTFEILGRNARRAVTELHRRKPDTSFLRVLMAGKRDAEYRTEQEKIRAWNALVERTGTKVVGKLAPEGTSTDRFYAKGDRTRAKAEVKQTRMVVESSIAPDDVNSRNIMDYLLNKK